MVEEPGLQEPRETYTHGHHASVLRAHQWRTVANSAAYVAEYLTPARSVLDIGCGPASITLDMARRVAPGRVVGVDRVQSLLDEVERQAVREELTNVEFTFGDAYALEFDDQSFDVVHAHQVLQHLADPVRALKEMRRVCRPDGVVAVRDADYRAMSWYPSDPALDLWLELSEEIARKNHGEPDAGRHLLNWVHSAGFSEIVPSASCWCFATPEDRAYWGGVWSERVVASDFAVSALDTGHCDQEGLVGLSQAWQRWAASEDGWFVVINGEMLCRP